MKNFFVSMILVSLCFTGCTSFQNKAVEKVPFVQNSSVKKVLVTRFYLSIDPEFDSEVTPSQLAQEESSFFEVSDDFDDVPTELYEPSKDIKRAFNVLELVKKTAHVYQTISGKQEEVEEEISSANADVVNHEHLQAVSGNKPLILSRYQSAYTQLQGVLKKQFALIVAGKDAAKGRALYDTLGYPQSHGSAVELGKDYDAGLVFDASLRVVNAQDYQEGQRLRSQASVVLSVSARLYDRYKRLIWSNSLSLPSTIPLVREYFDETSTGQWKLVRENKPDLEQYLGLALNQLTDNPT